MRVSIPAIIGLFIYLVVVLLALVFAIYVGRQATICETTEGQFCYSLACPTQSNYCRGAAYRFDADGRTIWCSGVGMSASKQGDAA